jgi:hypothetical protein
MKTVSLFFSTVVMMAALTVPVFFKRYLRRKKDTGTVACGELKQAGEI